MAISLWSMIRFCTPCLLLLCCLQSSALAQVLLTDTFNGPALDVTRWGIGTWQLGRTQLGNQPIFGQENGTTFVTLRLDTYNPEAPGTLLRGAEIYSTAWFALPRRQQQGVQFEARVRVRTETPGLVASFFTWGYQIDATGTTLSDEIDFEHLTKQPTNSLLLTSWNDWNEAEPVYNDGVHHAEAFIVLDGFSRNVWHTLQIRWLKDRTEWYVNGILVRSSRKPHPDDPMTIRCNLWAPALYWTAAYNAGLQPALTEEDNVSYYYDVDYIQVTRIP